MNNITLIGVIGVILMFTIYLVTSALIVVHGYNSVAEQNSIQYKQIEYELNKQNNVNR